MKKSISILLLTILLLVNGVALASDVSNAEYKSIITITNAGTAVTNEAVVFTLSTSAMIEEGMLSATADDAAMLTGLGGSDLAFMPSANSTYPWVTWINNIGEDADLQEYLYSKDVTGGKIRYFPGAGGMTTLDHTTLELSDNFTIEQKGWVDTDAGTDKYLDYKPMAFRTYVSPTVNGTITTEIVTVEDGFTADGWTDVGTPKILVNVGNSRLEYESERSAVDERCYLDVAPVNDVAWRLDYTFHPTASAGANPKFSFGLWDALANEYGYPSDALYVDEWWNAAVPSLRLKYIDGGGASTSVGATIDIANGNTYYITVERTATNSASLSVYSDATRTTHIAGSPKSGAIPNLTGLRYIAGSNYDDNTGAAIEHTGWIDALVMEGSGPLTVTATGISSDDLTVTTYGAANVPQWATGDVLEFDGTANSYITCGAAYGGETTFGISFQFKLNNPFTSGAAANMYLFTLNQGGDDRFHLYLNKANGSIRVYNRIGGADVLSLFTTQTSWAADTWYDVAATFLDEGATSSANITIDNAVTDTRSDATGQSLPAAPTLYIGAYNTTLGQTLDGTIQNVVIFTDALTDAEKTALYNGTTPGDETDYFYIDEGTGTAIVSYGTGGNDGTAGVATSWGTSTFTTGRTGRFCDFTLEIDDEVADPDRWGVNLKGESVPDNGNDWVFIQNDSMLFQEYQDIYIAGTQRQYIEWEYGTTFEDQSASTNDATPTFRTTSSDADLTASVTAQEGLVIGSSPSANVTGGWTMVTSVPSTPSDLFAEGGDTYGIGDFNIGELVTDAAVGAGQDPASWHIILAFALALIGMLGVYKATQNTNMGQRGSLILAAIAAEAVLIFFYRVTTIPGFTLIPFGLMAVALVIFRKSHSPVD